MMHRYKTLMWCVLGLSLTLLACQRPPLASQSNTTANATSEVIYVTPTSAEPDQVPQPSIQETVVINPPGDSQNAEPPTSVLPMKRQLTDAGCCTEAFWSADGQEIRFIDKPSNDSFVGVYGVPITGGSAELITTDIGFPQVNGRYLVLPNNNDRIEIVEVDAEQSFIVNTDATRISISPGFQRIAWARSPAVSANFDTRPTTIIVANADGSNQTDVVTLVGGGFGGWIDDDTILVAGTTVANQTTSGLYSFSLTTGELILLEEGLRIRTVDVAPGGDWIFYTVTLSGGEAGAEDGLWVVSRDGQTRYKLDVFGSAKWRNSRYLVIVPLELNVASHRMLQFDTQTGQLTDLLTPDMVQFKISQGDWSVSPLGSHFVYLSSPDSALWVVDLPRIPDEP